MLTDAVNIYRSQILPSKYIVGWICQDPISIQEVKLHAWIWATRKKLPKCHL